MILKGSETVWTLGLFSWPLGLLLEGAALWGGALVLVIIVVVVVVAMPSLTVGLLRNRDVTA